MLFHKMIKIITKVIFALFCFLSKTLEWRNQLKLTYWALHRLSPRSVDKSSIGMQMLRILNNVSYCYNCIFSINYYSRCAIVFGFLGPTKAILNDNW